MMVVKWCLSNFILFYIFYLLSEKTFTFLNVFILFHISLFILVFTCISVDLCIPFFQYQTYALSYCIHILLLPLNMGHLILTETLQVGATVIPILPERENWATERVCNLPKVHSLG